jgi:hypothetical protein
MPAAFALHIVEEYRGGFPTWVTQVLGGSFNDFAFALNNAGFFVVVLGLVVWVSKSGSRLAVSFSSLGRVGTFSGTRCSTC